MTCISSNYGLRFNELRDPDVNEPDDSSTDDDSQP